MKFTYTKLSTLTILLLASYSKEDLVTKIETPSQAIVALTEGNDRFIKGESIELHIGKERIEETAPHQEPFAAIIGCSDSRIPVELIFNRGIGDLFVIRTAGNTVAETSTEGSVDYAVLHLGVKAVVVLGHQSCGGIHGAITTGHADEEGKVEELLALIRQEIPAYVGHPEQAEEAMKANVTVQVERIKAFPHVKRLIKQGKLIVKGAYYNINTGKVTFTN